MKNLEEMERLFVEGALRAWSPSSHDAERVLLALDHRMADPGATVESSQPATPHAEPVPSLVGEGAQRLTGSLFLSPIPRWVLAAVALSGSAGAGYALGFRAGARTIPAVVTRVPESAPVPAPHAREIAPALREGAAPPTSEHASKTSPSGADEREEPAAPRSSGSARAKQASAALDEEVRTLRRVERALREQNPRLALALLAELDRAVPQGQLGEERFAASTQARCALGYGDRSALLEAFSRGHASSAYLARIRQACAPKTDEPGGSE
jgi:hypothetical protein